MKDSELTPDKIFEASKGIDMTIKIEEMAHKKAKEQIDILKPLMANASAEQIIAFGNIINYIEMHHQMDTSRNEQIKNAISNLEDKIIEGTD